MGITARELLGNIVHYQTGVVDKEITIDLSLLRVFERFPERFTPIPLTEEWLVKLGFERIESITQKDGLTIRGRKNFEVYVHDYNKDLRIEWVHQLQNLYFALVGEELKAKP